MATSLEAKKMKEIDWLIRKNGTMDSIAAILDKYPDWMHTTSLFHTAVEYGRLDVVRYIVENRANKDTIPKSQFINAQVLGLGALHIAVDKNYAELVKYLLEKENEVFIDGRTMRGSKSALHIAVENGNEDLVKLLVDHGANLEIKDNKEMRPGDYRFEDNVPNYLFNLIGEYRWAIKNNDPAIFEKYINKNASWLTLPLTMARETALHEALKHNHFELFEQMVNEAHRADPGRSKLDLVIQATLSGWNSLHYAVQSGNVAAVKYLLDLGVNINSQTTLEGYTSLHIAVKSGRKEVVELLMANGANLSIKDAEIVHSEMPHELAAPREVSEYFYQLQNTLLDNFKKQKYDDIKNLVAKNPSILLLPVDKNNNSILRLAVLSGNLEFTKYAIEKLQEYKKSNAMLIIKEANLLNTAVKSTDDKILNYFIKQGVDVKAKENNSLLHEAVIHGNKAIIERLIDSGVNLIQRQEYNKKTVVPYRVTEDNHLLSLTHIFKNAIEQGDVPTIEAYLKQNPSWLYVPIEGATILHVAARNNNAKIMEFLLDYIAQETAANPTNIHFDSFIYYRDGYGLTSFDYLAFHDQEAYHERLFDLRQKSHLAQIGARFIAPINYNQNQSNVIRAFKDTKGAILPHLTKYNPALVVSNDFKKTIGSQNSKVQVSLILEMIKNNTETLNYMLQDKDMTNLFYKAARNDSKFLIQLLTALPIEMIKDHEEVLKNLMLETTMHSRRSFWQRLRGTPVHGSLSNQVKETGIKIFMRNFDVYKNESGSSQLLKVEILQEGLFGQVLETIEASAGKEVTLRNKEIALYESVPNKSLYNYMYAQNELAHIYMTANPQDLKKAVENLNNILAIPEENITKTTKAVFLMDLRKDAQALLEVLALSPEADIVSEVDSHQQFIKAFNEAMRLNYIAEQNNKISKPEEDNASEEANDKVFMRDRKDVKLSSSPHSRWKSKPAVEPKQDQPAAASEKTASDSATETEKTQPNTAPKAGM